MSDDEWSLDPESEEQLKTCLAAADEASERRAWEYIAGVVRNPLGRQPDREDLWSAKVPRTKVTLAWTLDMDKKIVVIVLCDVE